MKVSFALVIGWIVVIGFLSLSGCDQTSNTVETIEEEEEEVTEDTTSTPISELCINARKLGSISTKDTPSPYLIGAPHGTYDVHTATIADALCSRLGWNCVVARGYVVDGVRINVSRPSEGAGLAPSAEVRSERSACVFDYYLSSAEAVSALADTKLYVEIHGSAIGDIQIATVGIDVAKAIRIRTILQAEWDARSATNIRVLVEPADAVALGATASKTFGMLSKVTPVLHFELPRTIRDDEREVIVAWFNASLTALSSTEFN